VLPLSASLVTDQLQNVGNFSDPAELVDAGALLLFTANGFQEGRELRAFPSADPTFLVTDLNPGAGSAITAPGGWLTRLGGTVLFVADDGSGLGRELWRTDGTAAGTALVKDLYPGLPSSAPEQLVAIGGNVWFKAQDGGASGTAQAKAFRSDGTLAGTVPVQLLNNVADEFVVDPVWFSSFGTSVVFSAVNTNVTAGRSLFLWDSSSGFVRQLLDGLQQPSVGNLDPVGFVTLSSTGYFGARDSNDKGYALWKTDGFKAGTTRVRDIGTLGGGRFSSAISFLGKLWFVGNDDVNGDELWTSDGTAAGTKMLANIAPDAGSGLDGSVLFPLPARGEVLFAADDGVTGRELWISDGTPLGTRLLHDIWPGPGSSNPSGFTAVGDLVFFTADDGSTGRELWVIDTSVASLDLTPPVPVCPAGTVTYEATSPAGADPTLAISVTDDRGGPVTVSFTPSSGFPVRVAKQVVATATDASGNRAQCSFTVFVDDTTPPTLTCPLDFSLEARSAAGADATFASTTAAHAVDLVTLSPTIGYAPASGSTFGLGPAKSPRTTPVAVTAFDAVGNSTTCAFHVTVLDSTPPTLTCPAAVTVEAVDPSGATTGWPDATAIDAVSPAASITIGYDATRFATIFPLGDTTVHASGRDEAGNVGGCGFLIHVVDTTPPTVTCPASFAVEATSTSGAFATFAATASDAVRVTPTLGYGVGADPAGVATSASGALVGAAFAYGTTTVGARAWDGFSFSPVCHFTVTVRDTTPPVITCPAVPPQEATGPLGRPFSLAGLASATDLATASPAVDYAAFGATVSTSAWIAPLGLTTVTATATDRGGNRRACDFGVTVRDTTPPTLTCPADFTLDAASAAGAVVTFVSTTAATATDLVTLSPSVGYAPASGSLLPVGAGGAPQRTLVNVTTTDGAGNPASCSFHVTVADTRPPVATCPADLTVEATGPSGVTLLAFLDANLVPTDATGVDAVTPAALMTPANGLVTYSPALGSSFPVGTTLVTATVKDAALNGATCTFQVHVVDTRKPVITCPASVGPVEATGNGAANVFFDVTAVDSVTLRPDLSFDNDSGHAFPLGTTTVHATATDVAGNQASCQFPVTVVDTTPPSIVCPADRKVPGNGGVPVRFPDPTVFDAGTPSPAITATHHSGDAFPVGVTLVTFTASDGAGNAASCSMSVTVHPTPFEGGGGCATGSGGVVALLGLAAALLRRRGPRRRP
jgi:ELWxxDGT repeat protein